MAIKPGVDHHEHTLPQAKMLAVTTGQREILEKILKAEQAGAELDVHTNRSNGRTTLIITRQNPSVLGGGGAILLPISQSTNE